MILSQVAESPKALIDDTYCFVYLSHAKLCEVGCSLLSEGVQGGVRLALIGRDEGCHAVVLVLAGSGVVRHFSGELRLHLGSLDVSLDSRYLRPNFVKPVNAYTNTTEGISQSPMPSLQLRQDDLSFWITSVSESQIDSFFHPLRECFHRIGHDSYTSSFGGA